jgi:GNAT superfamily N-acetyltransferase
MPSEVLVRRADLSSPADAAAYVAMLDMYSRDPLGDGKPLNDDVRARIVPALLEHPTTLIWLAFDGDRPIGVITAFRGFSSFKARPLVNIHDIAVAPEMRGKGVGKALLAAAEEHARETGCCRLTLEVLEHNPAKAVYESAGYHQAAYAPEAGGALFYTKPLD